MDSANQLVTHVFSVKYMRKPITNLTTPSTLIEMKPTVSQDRTHEKVSSISKSSLIINCQANVFIENINYYEQL